MAIAGKFGYAIYTLHTRKWKLFGNETQVLVLPSRPCYVVRMHTLIYLLHHMY